MLGKNIETRSGGIQIPEGIKCEELIPQKFPNFVGLFGRAHFHRCINMILTTETPDEARRWLVDLQIRERQIPNEKSEVSTKETHGCFGGISQTRGCFGGLST